MKSDRELFEGLNRALNYTLADYVRRHDTISGEAMLAAAMSVVIDVGHHTGAELGQAIEALRSSWRPSRESADPSDAPSG